MKINRKLRSTSLFILQCFILQLFFQDSFAQQGGPRPLEVFYKIDWNERLAPNLGLKPHDHKLLGDYIEPHTGRLSFEHIDVSIPGNSELPVEVRRRRNPSQSYNNEFVDWQLAVPTISTKIMSTEFAKGIRWGKKRCSDPLLTSIPNSDYPKRLDSTAPFAYATDYSDGVLLDVPGRASGQILDKTVASSWPSAAKKVTADGWYFTCLANIDGVGTEGFYGYAPNGERYKFDIKRWRKSVSFAEIWLIKYSALGSTSRFDREYAYYDVLAASEVLDVNGNWVRYVYDDQGKLTRIHSNDGRQIDLTYESTPTSPRVIRITSNTGTPDERLWSYTYGYASVFRSLPPLDANGAPRTGYSSYYLLKAVTLPDGRGWQFNLGGLFAEAVPGDGYKTLPGGQNVTCEQLNQTVSVTHPDGVVGEFELKEHRRFISLRGLSQYGPPCPNSSISRGVNTIADVMAVTRKTLSATGIPTAEWRYEYINAGSVSAGFNQTIIEQPDSSVQKIFFKPPSSYDAPVKEQIFSDAHSAIPLETKDYSYLLEAAAGSGFVRSNMDSVTQPLRQTEVTITRGSDIYKTRYTYNTNRDDESLLFGYSYGYPTKIEQWSNLGFGTRTTDIRYLKDSDDWILGLTSKVTKNGKVFDEYNHDTKGRVVGHKRLGIHVASMRYHSTGTQAGKLSSYREIWGRVTSLSNYHRGVPRIITRADNSQFIRSVDNNGQITRETNWRGVSTNFQYNNAGHLTLIDRPSPWTDTQVEYDYNGVGVLQTVKKGNEHTTTTYDAMLRPTQTLRLDRSHSNRIYTETSYDAMGRLSFTSLPADYSNSNIGLEKHYDALGRVIQARETASGGGITYYEYLARNKVRVRDPMNNISIDTISGFGSPDDGNVVKTENPHGITTDFTYDIYGNVLTMSQTKSDGTKLQSSYTYDSALRLCRMRVPERGDTLYAYNEANEFVGYAEGQLAGVGCATLPSSTSVILSYDNLKRLTTTDYPGSTPDVIRTYDANGNILTLNRGEINWTYTYNAIDFPVTETLNFDNRNYITTNIYNNDALITAKTYPSGRQYTFTNDGLGRAIRIAYGATNYLSNITYHPNGKINTLSRGNGGTYEQRLNERQLTSYIGGNWGDKRYYSYDASGRITSINSILYDVYDREFGYDGTGRLSSATGPWGTASYQFDALGNITRKIEGSRIIDIQYSTANRITSVRDSAASSMWRSYNHDARGNVTSDGRHSFIYDYTNQPVSISGATTGLYTYDGNLKRVKQVVGGETIYSIYDKSGALLTRDNVSRNEKTDYISLADQTLVRVKNGVATYPLNNHLGTALMEADQNGNVPANQVYNYTPWGETFDAAPFGTPGNDPGNRNEQGFTGHIEDATGLIYMQARYYDPIIGRFLSTDPIGYADQLNLYTYVYNDPINFTDPTGKAGNTSLGVWLGTYLATGDTKKANKAQTDSIFLHGEASMEVLSTMTRIGLAVDIADIGLEIVAGASADDEVTGVLAGEVAAELAEKVLDKKIGAEAAEVAGAIVGSVAGKITEEKVEEALQENVDKDKSTDRQ